MLCCDELRCVLSFHNVLHCIVSCWLTLYHAMMHNFRTLFCIMLCSYYQIAFHIIVSCNIASYPIVLHCIVLPISHNIVTTCLIQSVLSSSCQKLWSRNIWRCPGVFSTRTFPKDSLGPVGLGGRIFVNWTGFPQMLSDPIRLVSGGFSGRGDTSGSLTCFLALPELFLQGFAVPLRMQVFQTEHGGG